MATDILLDDSLDLIIDDGDFKLGDSNQQHALLVLVSSTGHWKQWPLLGFNPENYINANVTVQVLKRNMTTQLEMDGFKVNSIEFSADGSYNLDLERPGE